MSAVVSRVLRYSAHHPGDAARALRRISGKIVIGHPDDDLTQTLVALAETFFCCIPSGLCEFVHLGPVFSVIRLDLAAVDPAQCDVRPGRNVQDELPDVVSSRYRPLHRLFRSELRDQLAE